MEDKMPTTPQELREFIRDYVTENVSVVVRPEYDYGTKYINIDILLCGEKISSDYFQDT